MNFIINPIEVLVMGIISIVFIVVYLRMAWNIGQIRKGLIKSSKEDYWSKIDLAIFKEDKEKAEDLLHELLFILLHEGNWNEATRISNFKRPLNRLKVIGGKIPQEITDFIEDNKLN